MFGPRLVALLDRVGYRGGTVGAIVVGAEVLDLLRGQDRWSNASSTRSVGNMTLIGHWRGHPVWVDQSAPRRLGRINDPRGRKLAVIELVDPGSLVC